MVPKDPSSSDEYVMPPSKGYDSKQQTVLFATDLAPGCRAAADWATTLARKFDARLMILHVEQPFVPYGGGEIYSDRLFDYHSQVILKLLHDIKPSNPHVPYWHRLVTGDPATEVLRIANEIKPLMIVMGTHGRRGLPRMFAGSVAESIVRRATCPVAIFKSAPQDQVVNGEPNQEVKS
jgi:nucleotide-binding universal stress UspA family protein